MKKLAFAVTAASGAAAVPSHHDAEASTQHKVKSGESLWSIAQKYNTSVENIKQNNNLNNNMVFPGQVINVGGSASQSSNSNASSNTGSASTHTVKAGESLNIIANKYGVSVNALMKANNLNGYLITPGQTLKVPNGGSGAGAAGTATPSTGNDYNSPSFTTKTYILKVNVLGTCSINVHKLVNQLAHIGQMLNIGQQTQQMMVIK